MNFAKFSAVFLISVLTMQSTAFAAECSEDVKKALDGTTWLMTTEFGRGPSSWDVATSVEDNGRIKAAYKDVTLECSGNDIVIDWKNDSTKRYKLKLKNNNQFTGSRSGGYAARLKRK